MNQTHQRFHHGGHVVHTLQLVETVDVTLQGVKQENSLGGSEV